MSNTAHINMVTFQYSSEAGIRWNDWSTGGEQVIPEGMRGDPALYVTQFAATNPTVNTMRLLYNEKSFDENGDLHPEYEAFIQAAEDAGYNLVFLYGSGPGQDILENPYLDQSGDVGITQSRYAALEEYFDKEILPATQKMIEWVEKNPDVKDRVYGFELINEPAAYNQGSNTADEIAKSNFVKLYADHVVALSDTIGASLDAKILVGAWNFSGGIDRLANTEIAGESALDYIRDGVGDALVWSIHHYRNATDSNPGVLTGTGLFNDGVDISTGTTKEEFEQYLDRWFAPIIEDDILITEFGISLEVNNIDAGLGANYAYALSAEWFAENGIGLGTFSAQGANSLLNLTMNKVSVIPNQHALAHTANINSIDENPVEHSGDEDIQASEVAIGRTFAGVTPNGLVNQQYELDAQAGEARDLEGFIGYGFGYGGDDRIFGSDRANNFLYGGAGNDQLFGASGDDFLFGQGGADLLQSVSGINHLFGGDGDDTLIGGTGYDQLSGGDGADLFVAGSSGGDIITDFDVGVDRVDLSDVVQDGFRTFDDVIFSFSQVDIDNERYTEGGVTTFISDVDDLVLTLPNGTTLSFLNVTLGDLSADNFVGLELPPVANGQFDGTDGDDYLVLGASDSQGDTVTAGDDLIYGNAGHDYLNANAGNDVVFGGDGDDVIHGVRGQNVLHGEAGNDTIDSGVGASQLFGGDGNDILKAAMVLGGGHTLTGGSGLDVFEFRATHGNAQQSAKITDFDVAEDKLVIAGQEIDLSNPTAGISVSETAEGVLVGYGDNDQIFLEGASIPAGAAGQSGGADEDTTGDEEVVLDAPDAQTVDGTDGDDRFVFGTTDAQGDSVTSGDDVIYGNAGHDYLNANAGNDIVYGGDGNDVIHGVRGENALFGEAGNDTIDSGVNPSQLYGGDGDDILKAAMVLGGGHSLTGGAGQDVFEFRATHGNAQQSATITDFEASEDRLFIGGQEIDLSNPTSGISVAQSDAGLVVEYGDNDRILLEGTLAADLLIS